MKGNLATRVLVDWLEAEIARVIGDRERIALAYSGGLGSSLIAALARKRSDVVCYAVGVADAPDLEAAELAHAFLDYRIEKVRLTPRSGLALARRIAATAPHVTIADIFTLAPIWAVRERVADETLLTGVGVDGLSRSAKNVLERLNTSTPFLRFGEESGPAARARWSACAGVLGLPAKFGTPRRRTPGFGSGIEPAIRALAGARGTTVRALTRSPDYHVRPSHRSRRLD